ncbi:hypothetical protein RCL1_003652 [Eukaryota sp. TZLM3-RCL]
MTFTDYSTPENHLFSLHGKIAVVTGASSGIGVEMAFALARHGASVALLARRTDKLEQVAAEITKLGVKALPVTCDVTSTESVQAAAQIVKEAFGTVHIVINNAGGSADGSALEISEQEWQRVLDLNLTSINKVDKAFVPMMIEQKYGRVINIASIFGITGNKSFACAIYHATKSAVINYSRACAAEWSAHGITVNALCPGFFNSELTQGFFETDFFKNFISNATIASRAGKAGELDSAVVFLAAESSSYVTGIALPVDGGYTAI